MSRLPRRFLSLSCAALLVALAMPGPVAAQDDPADQTAAGQALPGGAIQRATAPDGRSMRAGSLVVKFRSEAGPTERQGRHRAAGASAARPSSAPGLARVTLPASDPGSVARALAAYRADPSVERAEPNYVAEASETPNDPRFGEQWGMAAIGAPAAWEVSKSAPTVKIALLDTGIADHPDLRGKVVASKDIIRTGSVNDVYGHGTHTAGIAAANTNNGVGVAGVGYKASLLNGKVLDDGGVGDVDSIVQGIDWAVEQGAQVISMSLGGSGDCPHTVQEAVNQAWARNVVVVAAAGNRSVSRSDWPGICDHVVAVASVDRGNYRASTSSYGFQVDVAAPGDGILSTLPSSNSHFSDPSGYGKLSGTSMATPLVAGVAALLWTTPHGTSAQAIVDRIVKTADPAPRDDDLLKAPRLNAAAAVGPILTATPLVSAPTKPLTARGTFTIRGTAPGGALVQVWRDRNGSGSHDDGDALAESVQLPSGGVRPFSIAVTLEPNRQNAFVVTATQPGAAESKPMVVPLVTEDSTPPAVPLILQPGGPAAVRTARLTVPGTAEPGSLVRIWVDANGNGRRDPEERVLLGRQQLAPGADAFSLTVVLPYTSQRDFVVTAADALGNESDGSAVPRMTLDVTARAPTDLRASPTVISPNGDGTLDSTAITYTMVEPGSVTVRIVTAYGWLTRTLVEGAAREPGPATETWDGKDARGRPMPAGAYAARLDFVDRLGNRAAPVTVGIRVDTAAPRAPIVQRVQVVDPEHRRLAGTAEVGAMVRAWPDADGDGRPGTGAAAVATGKTDGEGWFALMVPLGPGATTRYALTATDPAGNESPPVAAPPLTRP